MGNRGAIAIHDEYYDTPVVLYTHWKASDLPELLATALAKRERWRDPSYLARIIFDQVSEAAGSETTGAGITTKAPGDAWRVIDVKPADDTITFRVTEAVYTDERAGEMFDFEDFLATFGSQEVVDA